MNSSVTWERATSVMSSLCLEMSASSRSNGPSNTSRCTSKALDRAAPSGSPARSGSCTLTVMTVSWVSGIVGQLAPGYVRSAVGAPRAERVGPVLDGAGVDGAVDDGSGVVAGMVAGQGRGGDAANQEAVLALRFVVGEQDGDRSADN